MAREIENLHAGQEKSYQDLLRILKDKAAALKNSINASWQQYLSGYPNMMGNIDTWLNNLDEQWFVLTNSEGAQNRLQETNLMKKKGQEYAKNFMPWLRNEAPLLKNDTREAAVNKSAALIIEHATRRVDFYFMTALFFYNKPATITLEDTNRSLQHVHGTRDYKTEASHSAIISNFKARKPTGDILPTGPHLIKTLNTTVELPTVANDFDGALEGKIQEHLQSRWRKKSIHILHSVSGKAEEPRKALVKFLINMLDFFLDENIKTKYWSINSSVENKLIYVFQSIGTFHFLWSKTLSIDSYIHLFMRIGNDEAEHFQDKKYIRINKYKMLSDEIAGIPKSDHWIDQFFASDLTDKSKRDHLRDDSFTIDVIDNLLCYQETFESAMTLLLDLVDEDSFDYDCDNCHYNCHILFRICRDFSPLVGGISYDQRLKYLEHHLFVSEDDQKEVRSKALIRALYICISIVSLKDIPEFSDSLIYPEDTKIRWRFPVSNDNDDDPIIEKYYIAVAKLIIRAADHPDNDELCSDALEIINLFIKNNIDNLLTEYTTRQIINLFLIELPIQDWNDLESIGIQASEIISIFNKMKKNDFSMLYEHVSAADAKLFKRRIDDFYLCISIKLHRESLNVQDIKNAEKDELLRWYHHFKEDDYVEEFIYLYNHFNGNNSWENDSKLLDDLINHSSIQVQQFATKIKNLRDGVNRFYSEISMSGRVPHEDIATEVPIHTISISQKDDKNEKTFSQNTSNTSVKCENHLKSAPTYAPLTQYTNTPQKLIEALNLIGSKDDDARLLGNVNISRKEVYDGMRDLNNYYTADVINILLYPFNRGSHIRIYAAITPEQINEYLEQIKLQDEIYAMIPLNISFDTNVLKHKNHWVGLIIDKKHHLIFYMDPARKTAVPKEIADLYRNLDYKESIINNPIDFQAREKEEGWIRHCGVYLVEIVEAFVERIENNQCITGCELANINIDRDSLSLHAVLSSIPSGVAENVKQLREKHIVKIHTILLNNWRPSPSTLQTLPAIIGSDVKEAPKQLIEKQPQTNLNNTLFGNSQKDKSNSVKAKEDILHSPSSPMYTGRKK